MGVRMNSAQSVGALVTDVSDLALTVQGKVETVLPMTFTLLSENEWKLRDVFNFQGQAGFDRLVGNALHAYATLGSLVAGGHELVARRPDGVEIKLGLGLKMDAKS